MTHLRKIMLEELRRRNYAESTIRAYIRTVEHFSHHFHRPPDQLGPEHIRQYQALLFTQWRLAPNTARRWKIEGRCADGYCVGLMLHDELVRRASREEARPNLPNHGYLSGRLNMSDRSANEASRRAANL